MAECRGKGSVRWSTCDKETERIRGRRRGTQIIGSEIRELRKYLWGRGKEAYMAKRQQRKEK